MEAAIERGEFLEYARVHSNLYGTSFAAVQPVAPRGEDVRPMQRGMRCEW